MKFVKANSREKIWDPALNKIIAEFKDGEIETNDEYVINRLIELGYETEEVKIEKEIEHVKSSRKKR